MRKLLLLLITSMFITSCASILTGSKRKVLFETEPPGAKVFVNGFEKGMNAINYQKVLMAS